MAVNHGWVELQLRRSRDYLHAAAARGALGAAPGVDALPIAGLALPERRELEAIRANLGPAPQDERATLERLHREFLGLQAAQLARQSA